MFKGIGLDRKDKMVIVVATLVMEMENQEVIDDEAMNEMAEVIVRAISRNAPEKFKELNEKMGFNPLENSKPSAKVVDMLKNLGATTKQ